MDQAQPLPFFIIYSIKERGGCGEQTNAGGVKHSLQSAPGERKERALGIRRKNLAGRGSDRLPRRPRHEDSLLELEKRGSRDSQEEASKECHPGPVFQTALGRWAAAAVAAAFREVLSNTGVEAVI